MEAECKLPMAVVATVSIDPGVFAPASCLKTPCVFACAARLGSDNPSLRRADPRFSPERIRLSRMKGCSSLWGMVIAGVPRCSTTVSFGKPGLVGPGLTAMAAAIMPTADPVATLAARHRRAGSSARSFLRCAKIAVFFPSIGLSKQKQAAESNKNNVDLYLLKDNYD